MSKKNTAKKAAKKAVTKKAGLLAKEKAIACLAEESSPYRTHVTRFIDLFCVIGGFRIAFEKAGAKCVFSSDYDKLISGAVVAVSVPRQLLTVV